MQCGTKHILQHENDWVRMKQGKKRTVKRIRRLKHPKAYKYHIKIFNFLSSNFVFIRFFFFWFWWNLFSITRHTAVLINLFQYCCNWHYIKCSTNDLVYTLFIDFFLLFYTQKKNTRIIKTKQNNKQTNTENQLNAKC